MTWARAHQISFYIISLTLIISLETYAQGQSIIFSGKVIEKENRQTMPGVHVLNRSNGKGVVTDEKGGFMIAVQAGDTLIFSAIGYKTYILTTKDQSKSALTIEMEIEAKELKQVEVFAFRDENALKNAILEANPEPEEKLEIRGLKEGVTSLPYQDLTLGKDWSMKGYVNPQSVAFGPHFVKTGAISNLFKNSGTQNKANKRYKDLVTREKQIQEKYNPIKIAELTNLSEGLIEEFMKFCNL